MINLVKKYWYIVAAVIAIAVYCYSKKGVQSAPKLTDAEEEAALKALNFETPTSADNLNLIID